MNKSFIILAFSIISLLTNCKKEADRDQFIGTYAVSQECIDGQVSTYEIVISATGDGETVTIDNFANLGFKVNGTCTGAKVAFEQHSGIAPVNGTQVTFNTSDGEGTLANGVLTMPFSFTGSNGWANTCTMNGTKK